MYIQLIRDNVRALLKLNSGNLEQVLSRVAAVTETEAKLDELLGNQGTCSKHIHDYYLTNPHLIQAKLLITAALKEAEVLTGLNSGDSWTEAEAVAYTDFREEVRYMLQDLKDYR